MPIHFPGSGSWVRDHKPPPTVEFTDRYCGYCGGAWEGDARECVGCGAPKGRALTSTECAS